MNIFAYRNSSGVKTAGLPLWNRFTDSSVRENSEAVVGAAITNGSVFLIDPAGRAPESPVEIQLMAVLRKEPTIELDRLVRRVVEELYREELGRGAAVVDIGLFGSSLFVAEVQSALERGNGVLWEIG